MPDNIQGIVMWWSTYNQQWKVTEWNGYDYDGLKETKITTHPITSDKQLLRRLVAQASIIHPDRKGQATVIESAYSAVWSTDPKHALYLASQIEWLVCHEA